MLSEVWPWLPHLFLRSISQKHPSPSYLYSCGFIKVNCVVCIWWAQDIIHCHMQKIRSKSITHHIRYLCSAHCHVLSNGRVYKHSLKYFRHSISCPEWNVITSCLQCPQCLCFQYLILNCQSRLTGFAFYLCCFRLISTLCSHEEIFDWCLFGTLLWYFRGHVFHFTLAWWTWYRWLFCCLRLMLLRILLSMSWSKTKSCIFLWIFLLAFCNKAWTPWLATWISLSHNLQMALHLSLSHVSHHHSSMCPFPSLFFSHSLLNLVFDCAVSV